MMEISAIDKELKNQFLSNRNPIMLINNIKIMLVEVGYSWVFDVKV